MKNRSELREIIMKVLYQVFILKESGIDFKIDDLIKEQLEIENDFVTDAINTIVLKKDEIYEFANRYLDSWPMDRLNKVDQAILALGIYELKYTETPPVVAINEAVELSKKYSDELYDTNKIKFIRIGDLHDVFIVNSNSQYLNKKLSKSDLRDITIYTLKKFSSAYRNLVKALEYKTDDEINISNVDFPGIMELLKFRDIIAVVTKEYVEDKLANNELNELDVGFSLAPAEYGIYYNVNNKFKELNNLIEILKDNCKICILHNT